MRIIITYILVSLLVICTAQITQTTLIKNQNSASQFPIEDVIKEKNTKAFETILEAHFHNLQYFKNIRDYKSVAKTYYNLGLLNFEIGEYCLGQSYLQEALKIYDHQLLSNDGLKKLVLLSMMESYCRLNQYSELKGLLSQFKEYETQELSLFDHALLHYFYGYHYYWLDSFSLSEKKFKEATFQFERLKVIPWVSASNLGMAELHSKAGNSKMSLFFALRSIERDEHLLSDEFKCSAFKILYKTFTEENQLDEAIRYMNKFRQSFQGLIEKRKSFLHMENHFAKMEQEKQEAYAVSNKRLNLELQSTKNKIFLFVVFTIILSLVSLLVFSIYKQQKKYSKELNEMKKTLSLGNSALQKSIKKLEKSNSDLKYFSKIIAHDLNHPLLTILGYSNIIYKENKMKLNEYEIEMILNIINNSTSMSNSINELLHNSFPMLEKDQVKLRHD